MLIDQVRLALFDLDNTLLAGDSDFEWAQFLIDKGVLDRELHQARNQAFYDQYKAGTLDIYDFLAFQLRPLAAHPRSELDAWHREYMAEKVRPMIAPGAQELLARHAVHTRVIITATNSFVTAPIAREFGVEHLIATEPQVEGGKFTGRVAGIPCFKEGKIARLDEWLDGQGMTFSGVTESWFYSDSLNDIPLLSMVTHPVAVDPDPTLRVHAEGRDWPVMSLR
jgi:HAD superfamily hydrolase (TIGR01490 family)